MSFIARSRVLMRDAERHAMRLAAHMAEHDLPVSRSGCERRVELAGGHAVLAAETEALTLTAAAETAAALDEQKYFLASHLGELVHDQELDIAWSGDGASLATLANFREMRVAAVHELGPRMRRIRFAGADLGRFDTFAQLHVKLFIPPRGRLPVWPRLGRNGRIEWPDGDDRLAARKYTIRRLDVAAGTLDIDFVVHGDAGPGTAFARRAAVGDAIGIMGPGGLSVRPADWYLLAGDETALPAIARIVENLPPSARAVVRIEVADRSDEQMLESAAALEVAWLHRGGIGEAAGERLVEAVRTAPWPEDGARVFAWVGCERRAFSAIRSHLRRERGLAKEEHLAVAYWRADETHAESVALPADAEEA